MLLTKSAGSVRLYTVIHSRSELQCILPIERIIQDGGRLVVFIFIIARQRSSDGRQIRLIGTRPKASRAIEFAINRPTTNVYIYIYTYIYIRSAIDTKESDEIADPMEKITMKSHTGHFDSGIGKMLILIDAYFVILLQCNKMTK